MKVFRGSKANTKRVLTACLVDRVKRSCKIGFTREIKAYCGGDFNAALDDEIFSALPPVRLFSFIVFLKLQRSNFSDLNLSKGSLTAY